MRTYELVVSKSRPLAVLMAPVTALIENASPVLPLVIDQVIVSARLASEPTTVPTDMPGGLSSGIEKGPCRIDDRCVTGCEGERCSRRIVEEH